MLPSQQTMEKQMPPLCVTYCLIKNLGGFKSLPRFSDILLGSAKHSLDGSVDPGVPPPHKPLGETGMGNGVGVDYRSKWEGLCVCVQGKETCFHQVVCRAIYCRQVEQSLG
uniref:Uncharacterized protein n=1 Tax=Podarcis muralis TaxID=64176 RepID=A0A670JZ61_PODMU